MDDLKLIRKYYGEKMMHLCRELFPTLLEEQGLLYNLISSNFAHSKFLYDDIVNESMVYNFKDYIYSLVNKTEEIITTDKNPFELMADAGYTLYACNSEKDIQYFKKYYAPDEELCTFKGARLARCYVFFAVRKNIDQIKRFENPKRQDEYGTSVISIQFTRGNVNTLSIKNRYNHTVKSCDATFSNNLENIIPGLTYSFTNCYNLNINQNTSNELELENYVKAKDGKYYKYNYELDGVYYCPNNIFIDRYYNVDATYQEESERYILLDCFILDLKNKTINALDYSIEDDSFVYGLKDIEKINIIKNKANGNKTIEIKLKGKDSLVYIELDKYNRIVAYINNNIEIVDDNFLSYNNTIKKIVLDNAWLIKNGFMRNNNSLEEVNFPNVEKIGDYFLFHNEILKKLFAPKLESIGSSCLMNNKSLEELNLPTLTSVAHCFLYLNRVLKSLNIPNISYIGSGAFQYNLKMRLKAQLIVYKNILNSSKITNCNGRKM